MGCREGDLPVRWQPLLGSGAGCGVPMKLWCSVLCRRAVLRRPLPFHFHLQVAQRDPYAAKAQYKVTVYTSDVKFAGTDANVFIEIMGELP